MKQIALIIGVLTVTPFLVTAQETEVFSGCPQIKYEVTQEKAERTKIENRKAIELTCTVVRIGDEYHWKSRENRKMVMSYTPGAGTCYFIDPAGGGFIKVTQEGKGKIKYMEQIGLGLASVIYFGDGQYLQLDNLVNK